MPVDTVALAEVVEEVRRLVLARPGPAYVPLLSVVETSTRSAHSLSVLYCARDWSTAVPGAAEGPLIKVIGDMVRNGESPPEGWENLLQDLVNLLLSDEDTRLEAFQVVRDRLKEKAREEVL